MIYPIKGLVETSLSDWPGKVAAVLFLPLCNLRCPFCHNHGLVLNPDRYPDFPLDEVFQSLRRHRGWIDGVCLTGGEPTLHSWLAALIRELRAAPGAAAAGQPLQIKVDTNGTRPEILAGLIEERLVDYVAMDLKAPLEAGRYGAAVGMEMGSGGLRRVEESIEILLAGKVDFEFRTTLVPGFIQPDEVSDLARRIRGARRYTLQRFNPRDALDPGLREVAPWDEETVRALQKKVNEILQASL